MSNTRLWVVADVNHPVVAILNQYGEKWAIANKQAAATGYRFPDEPVGTSHHANEWHRVTHLVDCWNAFKGAGLPDDDNTWPRFLAGVEVKTVGEALDIIMDVLAERCGCCHELPGYCNYGNDPLPGWAC